MRWTLRRKFLILSVAMVVAATAATGLVFLRNAGQAAREEARATGRGVAAGLQAPLAQALQARREASAGEQILIDSRIREMLRLAVPGFRWAWVTDETGMLLAHTGSARPGTLPSPDMGPFLKTRSGIRYRETEDPLTGEPALLAEAPLLQGSRLLGAVGLGIRLDVGRRFAGDAARTVLVLTACMAGLALAGALMVSRRLTRPLSLLASEMDLAALDVEYPVARVATGDEIGDLFERFEVMVSRLRSSFRQLEEARRQVGHSEKLAALGRLAGGIAHEINNPLDGIRNCVEEVLRNPEDRDGARRYLTLVKEAVAQIEGVTRGLLEIARAPRPSRFEVVEMGPVAEAAVALVERQFASSGVRLVVRTTGPPLPVRGDAHQLRQVLLNLLLNARDASPEGGLVELESFARGHDVCVTVSDTGPGVEEALRERIFEPFFSSKEGRAGTGLGLSVSLGIVQDHGGEIRVRESSGGGAVFEVRLPRWVPGGAPVPGIPAGEDAP